ncbi:MAG: hypothetical protein K2X50_03875 [Gammaproteobacteria bacterium]|nr:hypothetical protein [Gammaproteobacteria bacterium]
MKSKLPIQLVLISTRDEKFKLLENPSEKILSQYKVCLILPLCDDREQAYWKSLKHLLYNCAWYSEEAKYYRTALCLMKNSRYRNSSQRDEYLRELSAYEEKIGKLLHFPEDYSSDSDSELKESNEKFSDAHDNDRIKFYRKKCIKDLKIFLEKETMNTGMVFGSENSTRDRDILEKATKKFLRSHDPSGLKAKLKRDDQSIGTIKAIKKKENGYQYKTNSQESDEEWLDTDAEIVVPLIRGIGYFTDRWARLAKKNHRTINFVGKKLHSSAAEHSVNENFYLNLDKDKWLDDEYQSDLHRNAKTLKTTATDLKFSPDWIAIKYNSEYRLFPNWLLFLQHLYTNGIERYKLLLEWLRKNDPKWHLYLPNAHNFLVSFSELPLHALRYTTDWKTIYGSYALHPRWDETGRAEKLCVGMIYAALSPIDDFLNLDSPNFVRYLEKEGEIAPSGVIAPELEVSFLSFYPADRIVIQRKMKFPSFHRPYHVEYGRKYGFSPEQYQLFKKAIIKTHSLPAQRVWVEKYLRDWLILYHSITIMAELYAKADKKTILYMNDEGGLTTSFPKREQGVRDQLGKQASNNLAQQIFAQNKGVDFGTVACNYATPVQIRVIHQSDIGAVSPTVVHSDQFILNSRRRRVSLGGSEPPLRTQGGSPFRDATPIFRRHDSEPLLRRAGHSFSQFWRKASFKQIKIPVIGLARTGTFYDINVPSDGTCMFYAIALDYLLSIINNPEQFLQRYKKLFGDGFDALMDEIKEDVLNFKHGIEDTRFEQLVYSVMRVRVVEYMKENAHIYANGIDDFQLYLKNMSERSMYAGNLETHAISAFLGQRIDVYHVVKGQIKLLEEPADTSVSQTPLCILYTMSDKASNVNNHYHALIEKEILDRSLLQEEEPPEDIDSISKDLSLLFM